MKIGNTAANFKKMNKTWSSTKISTRLKIRLYHSIYPSMSTLRKWNVENYSKTDKEAECIPSKMSTRVLKINYRDHVTNDKILRKTQSDTLTEMITIRRLKLAGHFIRMEENRCAKRALWWVPSNSKRKRGRPRITCRRTFKNDLERAGTTWDEATTLDKGAWKLFAARCPVMDWRT